MESISGPWLQTPLEDQHYHSTPYLRNVDLRAAARALDYVANALSRRLHRRSIAEPVGFNGTQVVGLIANGAVLPSDIIHSLSWMPGQPAPSVVFQNG